MNFGFKWIKHANTHRLRFHRTNMGLFVLYWICAIIKLYENVIKTHSSAENRRHAVLYSNTFYVWLQILFFANTNRWKCIKHTFSADEVKNVRIVDSTAVK